MERCEREETVKAIQDDNPEFDEAMWSNGLISPEAKDFIQKCLDKNNTTRMKAPDAM